MEAKISKSTVEVYTIPTDCPEADGTFSWQETTLVLVRLWSGSQSAIGFTYADESTAKVIERLLREEVTGKDVWDHGAILQRLWRCRAQFGSNGNLCDGDFRHRQCALGLACQASRSSAG